jgi:thiosulfate/3-mercaptopyruvate sulfurtransferase
MKKLLIFIILAFSGSLFANVLISAEELAKMMEDENVRIVSVQTTKKYKKMHIDNSLHINLDDLQTKKPVKGMLKTADEMAKILGENGVSNTNIIVVYDDKTGTKASRMYWLLTYLGAKDVRILDGQFSAWKKAKLPYSTKKTTFPAVTFTATATPDMIADMAYVEANLKNETFKLLDARAEEEYKGKNKKGEEDPKGHITGAVNIEYKQFLNKDYTYKTKAEIEIVLADNGITKDHTLAGYCRTSTRAAVLYVAINNILGWNNYKIYDGAYLEWSANKPEMTSK